MCKANNRCSGIEKSKNVQLGSLLFACGIYGVEEEEAWLLAEKFRNIEALFDVGIDSLIGSDLLNEVVAVNTYNFFHHLDNLLFKIRSDSRAGI